MWRSAINLVLGILVEMVICFWWAIWETCFWAELTKDLREMIWREVDGDWVRVKS